MLSKHNILHNAASIELYKLQPPVAPDDLLEEYCDFGKYRWFIDMVQYDERLMLRMAIMLRDNLEKRGKINRRDLFSSLRKMSARIPDKLITDHELSEVLFEIFERVIISGRHNFSRTCLPGYQQAIDAVLKKVMLSDDAVTCLIKNVDVSFRTLNRVVRYPAMNMAISKWARENVHNDRYRHKRIGMTALILNADPDYVLPMQLLDEDHLYFNQYDIKALAEAKIDLQMRRIYMGRFVHESDDTYDSFDPYVDEDLSGPSSFFAQPNSLKQDFSDELLKDKFAKRLMKRYYNWHPYPETDMERFLEDMDKLFYKEQKSIHNIVRMYAIGHSHLDANIKTKLLKKLYLETKDYRVIWVAAKCKNTAFLKWMSRREEV